MPIDKTRKFKEIYRNNALPTLYIDDVNTRRRNDNMYFLSFTTSIPNLIVEQVRLMIDEEHLHNVIDDMCRSAKYFPKKPKKSTKD
jgi:hypothetical protein